MKKKQKNKKKIYKFLYTMTLDITAKNEEEALKIFEETDLNDAEKSEFRDVNEIFEIDKNGIRKD